MPEPEGVLTQALTDLQQTMQEALDGYGAAMDPDFLEALATDILVDLLDAEALARVVACRVVALADLTVDSGLSMGRAFGNVVADTHDAFDELATGAVASILRARTDALRGYL